MCTYQRERKRNEITPERCDELCVHAGEREEQNYTREKGDETRAPPPTEMMGLAL